MVVKIIVSRSLALNKEGNLQYGFTLLEILLVLFLMGVILTVITPHFSSESNQIRMRVNRANVLKLEGAAQLYRLDVGAYPSSVAELVSSPGVCGWHGPYLDEIPTNPFNSAQDYQINASGQVK